MTPSWPRMPSSRCDTLVLPFVPVGANRSGRSSSRPGAVDPRREVAEQAARVVDDDDGKPAGRGDVGARGIRHDRDGALLGGGRGESAPWRLTPRIATKTSPGRRSAVASVMPGERHAGGVAADARRRIGPRGRRASGRGARPGGARGAGSRARRSAWRIHPLIRAASARHAEATRRAAVAVTANSKPEAGTVCGVEVIAFVIGVVAPGRGARRVDRAPRARPPVAREEVRRARRPVHDRLRPDAVVAAPRRDRSTGSRRSRSAATSRWRACTRRHRASAARAGHRSGRAGGGFFATMVQDARAANDETLQSEDDDRVFYKLPVWQRVVIMLGGPVMNLLFAIVLFAILLSGIGVQTATTTVAARQRVRDPAGRRPHRVRGIRSRRARGRGGHAARRRHRLGRRHRCRHLRRGVRDHPRVARRPAHRRRQRDGVVHSVTLTPMAVEQPVTDELGKPVLDEDGDAADRGGRLRRHPSGGRVPAPADLGGTAGGGRERRRRRRRSSGSCPSRSGRPASRS